MMNVGTHAVQYHLDAMTVWLYSRVSTCSLTAFIANQFDVFPSYPRVITQSGVGGGDRDGAALPATQTIEEMMC
jgi:hypothetical protein